MKFIEVISKCIKRLQRITLGEVKSKSTDHYKRYLKYSFSGNKCIDQKQYEAVITRWYHTIEKGLAYVDFRAGFGKNNLNALLTSMENYIKDGYSEDAFFYKTALSTLNAYQRKNELYGYVDEKLNERISNLPGVPNEYGGIIIFDMLSKKEVQELGFRDFMLSRHSMRHFSNEPVDLDSIKRAIYLAQNTPSACNRQSWRTIIISDKSIMKKVLDNQNGNEGFGQEFDKLLLIVSDNRCFNRSREIFQQFIDGGMYAQNVLHSLHYEGIASVPLSASLTIDQEKNVRSILDINNAYELIMFIGIGNYPNELQTARSERHPIKIDVH